MSIYGEAEPGGESLAATLSEGSATKKGGGGSLLGGFASWEAFKASRASQAAALLVAVGLIAAASSTGGSCATGAPAVATGDLDAYFSFDDMTAGDASGNCHDGRWEGQETYADGKKGKAASFDGASRILVDSFRNMQFGSQFSVSIFFKRTGGQQNYQGIVNNGYYSHGSFEIRMGREMGGEMLGGGICTAQHEEAWDHVHIQAKLNTWHHVGMVYDGAHVHFYLNGVPEPHASNDVGLMLVRDTPVVIGQAGPGKLNEFFVGLIDEVKLFTRALGEAEVGAECGCPIVHPLRASSSGALDAYYSFNDRTAADQSGHGYDGVWEGQESYAEGKPGNGKAAAFDGASRIVVDAFKHMEFGTQFSVSVFFERTGGQQNYQGIVNNGYCKCTIPQIPPK